jgi:hypothetical protein
LVAEKPAREGSPAKLPVTASIETPDAASSIRFKYMFIVASEFWIIPPTKHDRARATSPATLRFRKSRLPCLAA